MKGQLWIHASLRPYMEVDSPLEVSKRISNTVESETRNRSGITLITT